MSGRTTTRALTIATVALLLLAGACTKKTGNTLPSESPSASPSIENAGDFQLVGTAEHAFVGLGANVNVPAPTPSASASPAPASGQTATDVGVVRILLDDSSGALKDRCGAIRGSRVNVFWTTQTQFDPSLLNGNLESTLGGRLLGVVGNVYINPNSGDLPLAQASPGATSSPTVNTNCVVIASQIGTSHGTLPTAAPVIRHTARPAATTKASTSPSPSGTAAPTASATPTATPVATSTKSPKPTSTP